MNIFSIFKIFLPFITVADETIIFLIWFGVRNGFCCKIRAAAPDTIGVDIDEPLIFTYPVPTIFSLRLFAVSNEKLSAMQETISFPGANISGLTYALPFSFMRKSRPSSMLPAVIICLFIPGEVIPEGSLLPEAAHTIIPFCQRAKAASARLLYMLLSLIYNTRLLRKVCRSLFQ